MNLPWTCGRCGATNAHYGMCVASPECRRTAVKHQRMAKLLDLAREINPSLPPDKDLSGCVVTIRMSKDELSATFQGQV